MALLNVKTGSMENLPGVKRQVERIMTFMPKYLGALDSVPDASEFGDEDKGTMWYCTTSNTFKMWDGTAVRTITAS